MGIEGPDTYYYRRVFTDAVRAVAVAEAQSGEGPFAPGLRGTAVLAERETRPVIVFGFGLLHGLGFAGVLDEIDREFDDPDRFLYDVAKGLWAHYTNFGGNVV